MAEETKVVETETTPVKPETTMTETEESIFKGRIITKDGILISSSTLGDKITDRQENDMIIMETTYPDGPFQLKVINWLMEQLWFRLR